MAGLLVSVRSASEAVEAVRGGASVIDVKEPTRGPLGRAEVATWRAVRAVVPARLPLSVALGELRDREIDLLAGDFEGVGFRKLGLSGFGSDPQWRERWSDARASGPTGPGWVAVSYADWHSAGSPTPGAVLAEAIASRSETGSGCVGFLIDTWEKGCPSPLSAAPEWSDLVESAREAGLLIALAGGLDLGEIGRLAPLRPDLFAVRGAACRGPGRLGRVDAALVAELARGRGRVALR